MNEIETKLKTWRREYALSCLSEGGARCAVWSGGVILAAALLDAAAGMPLGVRWAIFSIIFAVAALGVCFFILMPLMRLSPMGLLRDASRRYPELAPYLLPAWELSKTGAGPASEALAQCHIAQTQRRLEGKPALPVYEARLSRKSRRGLAGLAMACGVSFPWLYFHSPGTGRILAPWREVALDQLWEITPGNQRVVWGAAVTISVRPRTRQHSSGTEGADLWLRTPGAPWAQIDWDNRAQGGEIYQLAEVNRPVEYQLRWKGERSRTYLLEPVPFPQLIDAKARIHLPGHLRVQEAHPQTSASTPGGIYPPSAAGKDVQPLPAAAVLGNEFPRAQAEVSLEGGGEVAALAGSWIVVHGRPSTALSHAWIQVSYLNSPVEFRTGSNGDYEAGFPLTQDGGFQFDLMSAEGFSDPHPISYRLKALVDQPPTAEILSPTFEVAASPREKLPITYEVRDDYGVVSADLIYRIEGTPGAEKIAPIQRFSSAGGRLPTEHIGDYRWDLSELPLGSRVEFQIRATDNNIIKPQFGYSGKGFLRLVDFEGTHARVERDWLETAKKMEELVKKEVGARAALKTLSDAQSPEERNRLEAQWREMDQDLARAWEVSPQAFQEFSDSMSKDPYANPALAEQAKMESENLKQAQTELFPAASKEAREKKWAQAEKLHRSLEAQARRAADMMSQGRELQAMQDFWSQAQRMDQAGKDLASTLSEMAQKPGKISPEDRRQLDKALAKLQEEMQAIAKMIESLPKPKTESASDRRKTFVVPINSARRSADALQKALAEGDYAKAAQIAQKMAEELGKTRQAIADAARSAAEDAGFSQSGEDAVSKKMEEALSRWQQAAGEQAQSLALAQKLEEERTKALLDAQRKLLEELAERQKRVVNSAAKLSDLVPAEVLAGMRAIFDEFTAKEVVRAPQLLEQTIRRLSARVPALPQGNAPLQKLARLEQGILDDLNKGIKAPPPTPGQAQGAAAADAAQGGAQGDTAELGRQLESLQEETGAVPPSVTQSVSGAQGEQGQARSALKGLDVPMAIQREQKALDYLQQGMKRMSSVMERQRGMGSNAMKPFSSSAGAIRPAGSRGQTGADTSFVPLPSAEDYKPPREIREDVEKSLQEKRPRSYDGVIKDYFKRISE